MKLKSIAFSWEYHKKHFVLFVFSDPTFTASYLLEKVLFVEDLSGKRTGLTREKFTSLSSRSSMDNFNDNLSLHWQVRPSFTLQS